MPLKGASHGLRFACFMLSIQVGYYPDFDWWFILPIGFLNVIAVYMGDEAWRINLSALIQLQRYVEIIKNILHNYFIGLIFVFTGFGIGTGMLWYVS